MYLTRGYPTMHRKATRKAIPPLLIAIAIIVNLQVGSTVSWSVEINRLTTYAYFDGSPTIVQTQNGSVWIVWAREILGNRTLYYKTSPDLGTTWSDGKNLTMELAPSDNTSPSIIQAMNGTIWVFWASKRPPPPPPPEPDFSLDASPKNLSIVQGGSNTSTIIVTSLLNFSEQVNLTVKKPLITITTTLNPSQVTPPPNGTANSTLTVTVETTATPGNYTLNVIGKSSEKSHSVNIDLEITQLGSATLSHSSFAASSSSSDTSEDYEIFYKTSNDLGASWSEDIQLTNNTYDDLSPSVVQLANGTIMVFWQSTETGNPDIFYTTTLDGASWTYSSNITGNPAFDKAPSAIQAEDGTIWLVWCSDRTGDNEIFYKTYNEMSWSNATRLTNSTNSDTSPSILQTLDNTIWIFWSSRGTAPTATNDVYYKCSSDNGENWSEPVQFTTDPYEDIWPSTTQTRDTKIWVLWTSNGGDQPDGNWDIYYKTSLAGDVNEDGVVDVFDLSIVGMAYGTFEGMPGYDADADINKDGMVDLRDLSIVTFYYGET